MIDLDLHIIDWNAISAIATTLAFIIAFWSIRISNTQDKKNREFQLKLMQKESEQRNLDEFIKKVIEIYNGTNPLDILNYSSKFINNQFSEQDKDQKYFEACYQVSKMSIHMLNITLTNFHK